MDKPPLGIVPRKLWDEKRLTDLGDAIGRYMEAGEPVPQEWILELIDLSKRNWDNRIFGKE